jgi:hypothetical protein
VPAQPGLASVETAVMMIPPPVTNLDLRLECETLASGPPAVPRPPAPSLRASLSLPGGGQVRVDKSGGFKLKGATAGCPAASPGPCTVTLGVSAAPPPKRGKGGKRGRAKALPLGTTTISVAAGATVPLAGKLSKSGLRRLAQAGRLKATLAIAARVPAGESSSGGLSATLLAPPKKATPPRR